MSRSALWRQEGNLKERERRADEIFQAACVEGRTRSKGTLPLWGPDNDTFHMNPLLLQNTIQSQYFQKCCTNLLDWNAIIDEIYYEVRHVHAFQIGKTPSTAFCLLTRLLCYRMTAHELEQTLKHVDSPYIRAIGFLFVRFGGCPVEQIWNWIEPYIHDEETEFAPDPLGKIQHTSNSSNKKGNINGENLITIGEFVRKLFRDREYMGGQTPLPRFPIHIERDIQVKLLAAEKIVDRARQHLANSRRMKYFETIGASIQALYGDEENPVTWYKAIIDRVITRSDDGHSTLKYPKFIVTFTEYGNTETVTLGEIDELDCNGNVHSDIHSNGASSFSSTIISSNNYIDEHRPERDRFTERRGFENKDIPYRHSHMDDRGGRSNHYRAGQHLPRRQQEFPKTHENGDLYEEIRRAERDRVASAEKSNWAPRRLPSTKSNLSSVSSVMIDNHKAIEDFSTTTNSHRYSSHHSNSSPPAAAALKSCDNNKAEFSAKPAMQYQADQQRNRKRTAEEIAAIEDKKRKLLSRYG